MNPHEFVFQQDSNMEDLLKLLLDMDLLPLVEYEWGQLAASPEQHSLRCQMREILEAAAK